MPNTKTRLVKILKGLGFLILFCLVGVVAGLLTPLESRGARAERLWQEGRAAYEAKDYETAVKLYKEAAEQGNEKAQFNLARCYAIGEGVEKDLKEAEYWFRKAAERGLEQAKAALERIGAE